MSSILFNCVIYYVNHLLRSKVNVLKTRARVLGYELEDHPCSHDLVLLQNSLNEKMGAVGIWAKKAGSDQIVKFECFLINIQKYKWAQDEGFTQQDIYDPDGNLRDMIFEMVEYDSFADKLR